MESWSGGVWVGQEEKAEEKGDGVGPPTRMEGVGKGLRNDAASVLQLFLRI